LVRWAADELRNEANRHSFQSEWPTDENGWIVKADGKHYEPNPGQAAFHDDHSVLRLIYGGRGSGKTSSGAQEAQKKIAEGRPGLIVAPDEKHFKKSTWPQLNEWIPIDEELTGLPMSPLVEHWSKGDQYIRFKTGATVWYGGVKEPDSWRGPNVNWFWYDEPGRHPMRSSFLILLGCIRIGTDVQGWLTTTPRGVLHWLYPYFIEKKFTSELLEAFQQIGVDVDPDRLIGAHHTSTFDNRRNLNPMWLATMMALYKGRWAEQELEGKFVSFEGLVYPNWDPTIHVIEKDQRGHIEGWWPKIRVVDFGFKNPFVCGWWARNPEGELIRYRELYMTERTVNEHARQILQLSEDDGNIVTTVCDWDAEDRATLEEWGIDTEPARKDIMTGIQTVTRMLSFDEERTPDLYFQRDALVERDPRLVAKDEPVCTEDEFVRYSWPQDREGRVQKEAPLDLYNHGMDMTRYAAMWDQGGDEFGVSVGSNPLAGYRG
jgi:hypothetical protein